MKRALVVVESMFGNTEAVAQALAKGLSVEMAVDVRGVADAPTAIDDDVDLVVVGGPTHAFGMSRPATRQAAVDAGAHPVGNSTAGIREWLEALPQRSSRLAAAAFDTRVKKRGVPGSAARAAARRLHRLGCRIVSPERTFYVSGTPGPLLEGELARAEAWGLELASGVTPDRERAAR